MGFMTSSPCDEKIRAKVKRPSRASSLAARHFIPQAPIPQQAFAGAVCSPSAGLRQHLGNHECSSVDFRQRSSRESCIHEPVFCGNSPLCRKHKRFRCGAVRQLPGVFSWMQAREITCKPFTPEFLVLGLSFQERAEPLCGISLCWPCSVSLCLWLGKAFFPV